jgi:SAM-dependent methyltransferase
MSRQVTGVSDSTNCSRIEQIFEAVYQHDGWHGGSGEGSFSENTGEYRQFLQAFMAEHQVRSVLDLGCGDWQFSRMIDWSGIDYTGVDCVRPLVERNARQYGGEGVRFMHGSIATVAEQHKTADLVLVKDVLQHWSSDEVLTFLPRLLRHQRVLFTNCHAEENTDTQTGGFRPLNLQVRPFHLPTRTVLRYFTKRVELWEPTSDTRKVLVLIPVKPNLDPRLKSRAAELAMRLPKANPSLEFSLVFDFRGDGDAVVVRFEDRANRNALLRQAIIDDYLGQSHAVLWVDADVVDYPADLPTRLIERSGGGVGAPLVCMEGNPERFYDIAGFVEGGRWARLDPPYFDQDGPVFELDSVGTIYLVPSVLYRGGAKHVDQPGYTEHQSVCTTARENGLPVRAFADLMAMHADLGRYGEPYH